MSLSPIPLYCGAATHQDSAVRKSGMTRAEQVHRRGGEEGEASAPGVPEVGPLLLGVSVPEQNLSRPEQHGVDRHQRPADDRGPGADPRGIAGVVANRVGTNPGAALGAAHTPAALRGAAGLARAVRACTVAALAGRDARAARARAPGRTHAVRACAAAARTICRAGRVRRLAALRPARSRQAVPGAALERGAVQPSGEHVAEQEAVLFRSWARAAVSRRPSIPKCRRDEETEHVSRAFGEDEVAAAAAACKQESFAEFPRQLMLGISPR